MKNLKKITAIVLALIIIASLAACSGGNSIVGKWNYDLQFKDLVESMVKQNLSTSDEKTEAMYDELFKAFDDCSVIVTLEFKDDGTFTFAADKASAEAAVEKVKANLKTAIPKAYAAMGVSEDDFDRYLKLQGKTIDDLVAEFSKQFNVSSFDTMESSGKYVLEGNKLYMYTGDTKNDSEYCEIEMKGNEFDITKVNGDIESLKGVDSLLPMKFTKA